MEKPDLRIFSSALAKLNIKKDQVIMIGDNHEKDIMGARQYGINAYLLKDIR